MTEQKLDQLFESARNAELQTSREEVTQWLAAAAVATATAGVAAAGFKLVLTKNMIAMIVGTLSVAGIAVVSTGIFSSAEPELTPDKQNSVAYFEPHENKENTETTFYAMTDIVEDVPECATPAVENPVKVVVQKEDFPKLPEQLVAPVYNRYEIQDPVKTIYRKDTVREVSSREIEVGPFTQLQIDGIFDVIIVQGDEEGVVVESGGENLMVNAENVGDMLVLSTMDVRGTTRCKDTDVLLVRVTVKELSLLRVTGVGNVTVEQLNAPNLIVEFDGIGDLEMNVTCENFEFISGGVGNVNLMGVAATANYVNTGIGDVQAYELKAHDVTVISSAVGNMYIFADKSLVIEADGVGDIRYQGSPDLKQLSFEGVGTLKSE